MAVMRDVDFLREGLSGGAPPLDRTVVYRYRSGVLRPRVLAVLQNAATRLGHIMRTGKVPLGPEFLDNSFPIPQVKVHTWPVRAPRGNGRDAIGSSLALLAANLQPPSLHFVPCDSPVARHPGWRAVERGVLCLEEPRITRQSLLPILRYLVVTTDLALGANPLEQRTFVASFGDLVEAHAELPAIIQAFEERVLLCIDTITHRYDDSRYQREAVHRQGRRRPLQHLRDLVALRREDDLIDLLCGVDERRAERGWSALRLVVELYNAASRLLEPMTDQHSARAGARGRVAPHRVAEGAVLWIALLLASEDALIRSVREDEVGYRRGPDLIVAALAGLGRDFLAREDCTEAGDPLTGRWPAVARSLGRCGTDDPDDPLVKMRGGLVRELASALDQFAPDGPDWFRDLQEGVSWACVRLDAKAARDVERGTDANERLPPLIRTPPPTPLHQTFTTVIGREHAANALRRHARERRAGIDLLLHGPAGVGKRTLAVSYARMVLCTNPSDDGSACEKCDSCQRIRTGDGGCIEVDGARSDIERLTDQILGRIRSERGLLADRYVFVIRNADHYPPDEFDRLLNPLEDDEQATFVLLARERRAVRLAVQSRCFDYRVRPLNQTEAERFVRKAFTSRSLSCDEAIVALVVAVGSGVPRRLVELCEIVAGMAPTNLGEVRERFALGWADALGVGWPEIVAETSTRPRNLLGLAGLHRAEHVRRVQTVLRHVSPTTTQAERHARSAVDPAVLWLDEGVCDRCANAIVRQADREGSTVEVVWARLAQTWLADRLSYEWSSVLGDDKSVER